MRRPLSERAGNESLSMANGSLCRPPTHTRKAAISESTKIRPKPHSDNARRAGGVRIDLISLGEWDFVLERDEQR